MGSSSRLGVVRTVYGAFLDGHTAVCCSKFDVFNFPIIFTPHGLKKEVPLMTFDPSGGSPGTPYRGGPEDLSGVGVPRTEYLPGHGPVI